MCSSGVMLQFRATLGEALNRLSTDGTGTGWKGQQWRSVTVSVVRCEGGGRTTFRFVLWDTVGEIAIIYGQGCGSRNTVASVHILLLPRLGCK